MYKYHNQLLPPVFISFFTKITQIHNYNTRLAAKQSCYPPKARTNYGIFNVRFQGPSVWNSLDEDIISFSLSSFKKKRKQHFIKDYLTSVHRFCNSKIRYNTVLQCKTFSHFNILVVYLNLFIFIFVCIYVCLCLCP